MRTLLLALCLMGFLVNDVFAKESNIFYVEGVVRLKSDNLTMLRVSSLKTNIATRKSQLFREITKQMDEVRACLALSKSQIKDCFAGRKIKKLSKEYRGIRGKEEKIEVASSNCSIGQTIKNPIKSTKGEYLSLYCSY